jgi:hypothetical protein
MTKNKRSTNTQPIHSNQEAAMPRRITTTTTVYTLDELNSLYPAGFNAALDNLFEDREWAWQQFELAEVIQAFQDEHEQPALTAQVDLYRNRILAEGYLQVPEVMRRQWIEHLERDDERVPVGEFYGWTGWNYYVGGEMYTWIPDEDGQSLLNTTNELMENLLERLKESHDALTNHDALREWANDGGLLFLLDGAFVGDLESLGE